MKCFVVMCALFISSLTYAAKVKINKPGQAGYTNYTDILAQLEVFSVEKNRVIFKGDLRKWSYTSKYFDLAKGNYRFKMTSHNLYTDILELTVNDEEIIELYYGHVFSFHPENFPWIFRNTLEPNKAVNFWRQKEDPSFVPLKRSSDTLGELPVRISLRDGRDTLIINNKSRACIHRFPLGLFLLENEELKLNGISLKGRSVKEDHIYFPAGILQVELPTGISWSLENLATKELLSETRSCSWFHRDDGTKLFTKRKEFLVPAGDYLLIYGSEEKIITIKDKERFLVGEEI